jgi:hypothetical protein
MTLDFISHFLFLTMNISILIIGMDYRLVVGKYVEGENVRNLSSSDSSY